jgi:hypothetical protein
MIGGVLLVPQASEPFKLEIQTAGRSKLSFVVEV